MIEFLKYYFTSKKNAKELQDITYKKKEIIDNQNKKEKEIFYNDAEKLLKKTIYNKIYENSQNGRFEYNFDNNHIFLEIYNELVEIATTDKYLDKEYIKEMQKYLDNKLEKELKNKGYSVSFKLVETCYRGADLFSELEYTIYWGIKHIDITKQDNCMNLNVYGTQDDKE